MQRELLPPHMRKVRELREHQIVTYGCDWYKRNVAEPVMAQIDVLPAELRALVHEFGWLTVRRRLHLRSAKAIRADIMRKRIARDLADIEL